MKIAIRKPHSRQPRSNSDRTWKHFDSCAFSPFYFHRVIMHLPHLGLAARRGQSLFLIFLFPVFGKKQGCQQFLFMCSTTQVVTYAGQRKREKHLRNNLILHELFALTTLSSAPASQPALPRLLPCTSGAGPGLGAEQAGNVW